MTHRSLNIATKEVYHFTIFIFLPSDSWADTPEFHDPSLAVWEGPQLLLAKVKNASGRIGIFSI